MRRKPQQQPVAFQMPTQPPWEYEPEGPYVVIAVETVSRMPIQSHEFRSPFDAMRWWWRFHVGPIEGRCVAVCDAHLQFLVGYMAEPNEVSWFGCEAGYCMLETAFPDKPEVHIWEASARGLLPNDAPTEAL